MSKGKTFLLVFVMVLIFILWIKPYLKLVDKYTPDHR